MIARFGDLLASTAHRNPDAPAVTFQGKTRTWHAVWRRAASIAAALEGMGLEPGDRVAYLGFNSDALFELYFAPAMARAELVVMNFRWSLPECLAALEECTPKVLIFDATHAETARAAAAGLGGAMHLVQTKGPVPKGVLSYEDLARRDRMPAGPGSGGDDTLIIYFTGGTTGRPKGVMISHQNMLTNALGAPPIMRCAPGRAQIIIGPMFHMAPGSRIFSAVKATPASGASIPCSASAEISGVAQALSLSSRASNNSGSPCIILRVLSQFLEPLPSIA